jgi:hypothetical protein
MELSPVKPGWKLEKQPATRAKDTEKLRQIAARVLRVLDDMSRQDEIEGRRLEGKIFSIVQPREETLQSFEAPTTKLETQWVHLDAVDGSRSRATSISPPAPIPEMSTMERCEKISGGTFDVTYARRSRIPSRDTAAAAALGASQCPSSS